MNKKKLNPNAIEGDSSAQDSLGPLPTADRKAELQRRSLAVLRLAFPADRFLFRPESTEDAGVDGSLELLIDSAYTDLRSQVQLKSTDNSRTNRDGTISIQIKVANLNYLLNGPSPLYLLYVEPRDEFRFVWARDERKRLDNCNRKWITKKFVTLRFGQILSDDTLDEIHERIRREAQLTRQINDRLDAASNFENVTINIDSQTLRITTATEAKERLLTSGFTLVSSGYASEVVELKKLLDEDDAREPRVALVLAHAEYMLSQYLKAHALLRDATLRADELSEDDRSFLQMLSDACDYQRGQIDAGTAIRRATENLQHGGGQFSTALKLNRLRYILLNEADLERRSTVLDELKSLVDGILSSTSSYSPSFKSFARISLAEAEGYQVVFLTMRLLGEQQIKQSLPSVKTFLSNVFTHTERLKNWQTDIDNLLKDAAQQNHPMLLVQAVQVQVTIAVHYVTHEYRFNDGALKSDNVRSVLNTALGNIEGALKLSLKAMNLEAELRSRMLIADIYELLDRKGEAQEIARQIMPKAKAMEYAALIWRADAHLTGNTLLDKIKEWSRPKSGKEDAEIMAGFSDDEVSRYAKRILEIAELPDERLPVVERDCLSRRDISTEKLHWCRHIELIQDLEHEKRRETHFARDPNRYCKCLLLNHESRFGDSNWGAVIKAFKRTHCQECCQRSPYNTNN